MHKLHKLPTLWLSQRRGIKQNKRQKEEFFVPSEVWKTFLG